jgi:hypothetical protein
MRSDQLSRHPETQALAVLLAMRGLDPRIHALEQTPQGEEWIAGSSPAMTKRPSSIHRAPVHRSRLAAHTERGRTPAIYENHMVLVRQFP